MNDSRRNPIDLLEKIAKGLDVKLYELFLFSYELQSEKAVKKGA